MHLNASYETFSQWSLKKLFDIPSNASPQATSASQRLDKDEILAQCDFLALFDSLGALKGQKPLRIQGQEALAVLCSFHNEKTPSLHLNFTKKLFYCHGCNKGGDFFRFIMLINDCSFIDSMKIASPFI